MIRALATGTLYDAPQARTSQAGKTFTTAKVRAGGMAGALSTGCPLNNSSFGGIWKISGNSRQPNYW